MESCSKHAMKLEVRPSRRDILVWGSIAALSPWLSKVAAAESLLAAETAALPLSVGYIEGSAGITDLKRLPFAILRPGVPDAEGNPAGLGWRVVPADELPLGDTSIVGRPLKMRVHGLYPGLATAAKRRRSLPLAVDLEVLVPSPPDPTLTRALSFSAWSMKQREGWNPSPPIAFTLPLDWEAMPTFAMDVTAADGTRMRLAAEFTVDTEAGRPRLHRGLYLLGLAPFAWRTGMGLPQLAKTAPVERSSILVSIEPIEPIELAEEE